MGLRMQCEGEWVYGCSRGAVVRSVKVVYMKM